VHRHGLEHFRVDLIAHLQRVAAIDEDRRLLAQHDGVPADPEKPVSQASRSADLGTYSPWCSSARGTMKPSSEAPELGAKGGDALGTLWSDRPTRKSSGTCPGS
jgi:hypothetical protein